MSAPTSYSLGKFRDTAVFFRHVLTALWSAGEPAHAALSVLCCDGYSCCACPGSSVVGTGERAICFLPNRLLCLVLCLPCRAC